MSDDSPKVITPLPTTITTAATTTTTTTPPSPTYPSPIVISPHITLQAPLSRRGRGPGLILVLDHYARLEKSHKYLDPLPLQKWAEEGFCVVQLLVPGKVEDGGEFALERAVEILEGCEGCEMEGGVGVICMCVFFSIVLFECLDFRYSWRKEEMQKKKELGMSFTAKNTEKDQERGKKRKNIY